MVIPIGIVGITAAIMMAPCLLFPYEVLRILFMHSPQLTSMPRTGIAFAVAVLFATHVMRS